MTVRDELTNALARRHRVGTRDEKTRILDEYVSITVFNRKHAMRLLRSGVTGPPGNRRVGRGIYGEAVAGGAGCAMGSVRSHLRQASRATHSGPRGGDGAAWPSASRPGDPRRSAGHGRGDDRPVLARDPGPGRRTALSPLRGSIPVRAFSDWDDPPPGFVEADLVAHSGPVTRGSFAHTLLTDIATGWTEFARVPCREQTVLPEVLSEIRRPVPCLDLGRIGREIPQNW